MAVTPLVHDVRSALRLCMRRPGLAAAVAGTLALGIGANAAFFSVVNAALLRPFPVREPDRLANIYMSRANGSSYGATSYADYRDLVASTTVFDGVAGYGGFLGTITGEGRAEPVFGELVTGNYFQVLGVTPVLGHPFRPEEDRTLDAHPVTVLGYAFWQRRFGGDPAVAGRTLTLNGRPYTIIGVAPPGFNGMLVRGFAADLWVPTMMMGHIRNSRPDERNERWLFVTARLADGVSAAAAAAAAAAVARNLEREYPATNEGRRFSVVPAGKVLINPDADRVIAPVAAILLAAAGLVLLVACANLTGLQLARASSLRREVAVRLALGAGRARIVRQLLVESVLLAALGGGMALLLADWLATLLIGFRPPLPVPLAFDVRIDGRVAAYTATLSALAALAMGLPPALRSSRTTVVPALRGDIGVTRRRRWGLRQALLVPQVSTSFVLLLVAALFARSVSRAGAVDPGFDLNRTALVALNLGQSGYDEARARRFYERFTERVRARAGVRAAAVTDRIPLDLYGSQSTTITGEMEGTRTATVSGQTGHVGAGYFEALGITILGGRVFTEADVRQAAQVAIIGTETARRLWPGANPIGRRLRLGGDDQPWLEVVGVTADVKVQTLGEAPVPFVYRPLSSGYTRLLRVVAGVDGSATRAAARLREDAELTDEHVAVFESGTMGDVLGVMLFPFRMAAGLGSALGMFTLVLAGVGLYGVAACALAGRRRELAIRVALGAAPGDVVRLVIGEGLAAVVIGLVVGLPAAILIARFVGAWLFGVSPVDPLALGGATLVLATAALAAGIGPARRAIRIDPAESLRIE